MPNQRENYVKNKIRKIDISLCSSVLSHSQEKRMYNTRSKRYIICKTCHNQYYPYNPDEVEIHFNGKCSNTVTQDTLKPCKTCLQFYDPQNSEISEIHEREVKCDVCLQIFDGTDPESQKIHLHGKDNSPGINLWDDAMLDEFKSSPIELSTQKTDFSEEIKKKAEQMSPSSTNLGSVSCLPSAPPSNEKPIKKYSSSDMNAFWHNQYSKRRLNLASILNPDPIKPLDPKLEDLTDSYRVYVKSVLPHNEYEFQISQHHTVLQTKMRIGQMLNVNHKWITMICFGKRLKDDILISDSNITSDSKIHILVKPPSGLKLQ